jgi:Helix-turn-helix domain
MTKIGISGAERKGRTDRRVRTMPLWPDAGEQLGLSRNGTYDAANRGEIPTLRFGRKLVVPIDQFEKMLAGE